MSEIGWKLFKIGRFGKRWLSAPRSTPDFGSVRCQFGLCENNRPTIRVEALPRGFNQGCHLSASLIASFRIPSCL